MKPVTGIDALSTTATRIHTLYLSANACDVSPAGVNLALAHHRGNILNFLVTRLAPASQWLFAIRDRVGRSIDQTIHRQRTEVQIIH